MANIMLHLGEASLFPTISMTGEGQHEGILISKTEGIYVVSHGKDHHRIKEMIEDEAFYRDFRNLDNYNAAEQGNSHVFVVPGRTKDNNYPNFPEFSPEIEWPVGCPLQLGLPLRLAGGLPPRVYQIPPLTPVYGPPIVLNDFLWFGFVYPDDERPPQPPAPRRRSIPKITLRAVQEEIEEDDMDPPPIQVSHIRRTSSAQAIRSNWLGEPIVEYRATRSEGHGSDVG